jgi:WD40 repeat protein
VDLLWADNMHEVRRYKAHCGSVQGLSFSSDSQTLASGAIDCMVKFWPIGKLQGSTVKQAADGSICLAAGDANIIDAHMLIEGGRVENLGGWNNASDRPAWTVEVAQAGIYKPELIYSAAPSNGGQIALTCGDAKSQGTIVETEGWYDYHRLPLPPLELKAGTVKITLAATKKAGDHVMNLRYINFAPVPATSK